MPYLTGEPLRYRIGLGGRFSEHRMTDKASHHEENYTHKGSPAEVDHPNLDQFPSNDVSDKVTDKESGNSDQDIDENGKDVPAKDQMGHAAVKC